MKRTETEPEFERSLARELRLVRRRSRLPWVYSVYHRSPTAPADPGRLEGEGESPHKHVGGGPFLPPFRTSRPHAVRARDTAD